MNQYGQMARRHWARWLPGRFATIENPEAFFTGLGDEAEQKITALAWELAEQKFRMRRYQDAKEEAEAQAGPLADDLADVEVEE